MRNNNQNLLHSRLKGGTMKTTATIFSVLIITVTLVFGFNAVCMAAHPDPSASVYEDLLNQYIARCDAKIEMKNSNLSNIRRDAAIAVIKGTFAKTHREELLIDMIQKEVDPKSYKVQVYLNDQFYSLVRDKKSTL